MAGPSDGWNSTAWTPEPDYTSDVDNISRDFYSPAMGGAVRYDRITGFFSSGAFILYWPALRAFVARNGRIRLLCSPKLSSDDTNHLSRGYAARNDRELKEVLKAELDDLLGQEELRKPALAFAGLISQGVIEVKFARISLTTTAADRRMFHDKVGLFRDRLGATIGFRGSANETYLGLSAERGNVESIDAWPSWAGERDELRVRNAIRRFDRLWNGYADGIEIFALPDGLKEILEDTSGSDDWRVLVDELASAKEPLEMKVASRSGRPLRRQQVRGLARWRENGRRGILAHATGSGKTVTGIHAIGQHHGPTVVVAPSELVADQWLEQIRLELGPAGRRVHLCGAGDVQWKTKLRLWMTDPRVSRIAVAIAPTAASARFLAQLTNINNLLFVADEVHRLGAPSYEPLLNLTAQYRLGLSATPQRAGDPEGTQKLMTYFGGIVDRYTLDDAMHDNVLCNYVYHPQVVRLNEMELGSWEEYTRRIGRALATNADNHGGSLNPAAKVLMMQRAKIAKKAAAKTPAAIATVAKNYKSGDHWLIYCDDTDQMDEVAEGLRASGIDAVRYFSTMTGDKDATLRHFRANGGVVVSIKCLDEGVDIPECSHALIAASSRNPREFIQRRGRVLRKTSDKSLAVIHDLLVVPSGQIDTSTKSLVWGELARSSQFARSALNTDARLPLEDACIELGIELIDLYAELDGGVEDDDPE